MAAHAGNADHAILDGTGVHSALPATCVAEDGRNRGVSGKGEVGECAVVPDPGRGEFGPRAGSIIGVRGGECDGVCRPPGVLRIPELDHIEGWARGFTYAEIIAPPIGVYSDIGANAAGDRFDREGAPARHTIDLEPFGVTGDDRADALALAELDGRDMGKRDAEAVDLALLVGGDPDAAVIRAATRDGFSKREGRDRGKTHNKGDQGAQTQFSNLSERTAYSTTVNPNGLVQTWSMDRLSSGRNSKSSVAVNSPA